MTVPYSSPLPQSLGQLNNVQIDTSTLVNDEVIAFSSASNTWKNVNAGTTHNHNEISQLNSSVIVTDTGANGLVTTTIDGTVITTIDSVGLGVGTTTPAVRLDIKETTSNIAGEIILGGSLALDDIPFGKFNFANTAAANSQTNKILAYIAGEKVGSSNQGELTFATSNSSSPAERMRITAEGNVGIGVNPTAKLDVTGSIKMVDGNQGLGKVLTSDATGLASWGFYEEGSWTPLCDNVVTSSSSMYGKYTKMGKICFIHAKIDVVVASLPGAQFAISGLPFAAADSTDAQQRAIIAVGGDMVNVGGNADKMQFITDGSVLKAVWINSGNTNTFTYNIMDSTTFELHIHGFYTTT